MKCGIYLRISKEEESTGSNSIAGQRMVIEQFVHVHNDMEIAGEWCDDGYSGINFDRPGVKDLIRNIYSGRIECVIVKDLSRFGRDYIQTGKYIKYIFPGLGVRFIAVCDNYDSQNSGFLEDALLMPIMNLVNDAYCRDISNKVRWQQEARRKQGIYIGAFAVYGYIKSEKERGKLVVDEYAADIVRWIFNMRLNGKSAEKIAKELDLMEIPSPYAYKKLNNSRFTTSFARNGNPGWSPVAVRRILSNEVYTGVLLQGKDRKTSYKLPLRKKLPKEEWIRAEGAVTPLISKEVFKKVQEMDLRRGIK
ncbi:MAG: recombinase family protein [Lachnospiraceae bacterium]|nr:recombinase family protein [Lachnospiraceae bacterium]